MNAVGSVLSAEDDQLPSPVAEVFLRRSQRGAIELIPRSRAQTLLELVTAIPLLDVTGDLARGFAWPVFGAQPRRSYAVVPLSAPVWPNTLHPAVVTIELWWRTDEYGRRAVRTFVARADDSYHAYLIACCLWSTRATGAGAEAAFLYGPDRQTAYRITAVAWTCSQIPAETIARAAATALDRYSTDPLPDTPRTSVMHEERVDRVLTYTGTSAENRVVVVSDSTTIEAS